MPRAISNRVTYGDAILRRFAGVGAPGSVKGDLAAFKAQHGIFVKAADAVAKAETAYDTAAEKVAKLDAGRDKTVLDIADKLPAAGLGSRTSPFAEFSKYAPAKVVALPYAAEGIELGSLLSGILGKSPPGEIVELCKKGNKQNEAVGLALQDLEAPLSVLNEARAKRDAAIPDWEKHLRRLKDSAKVAFRDTAGRFEALFAEPEAIQTNVRPKRRPKPKTQPAPDAGAAAPPAKPARKRRRGR